MPATRCGPSTRRCRGGSGPVASIHRSASADARSGSTAACTAQHVVGAEGRRVSHGPQDRAVQLVDQHDDRVRAARREPDHRAAGVVMGQRVHAVGMVAHEGHSHLLVGQQRPGQPRAGPRVGQALPRRDVVRDRHQDVDVAVLGQSADEPGQPARRRRRDRAAPSAGRAPSPAASHAVSRSSVVSGSASMCTATISFARIVFAYCERVHRLRGSAPRPAGP